MNNLFSILAPAIIIINALFLLVDTFIDIQKEKKEKTAHEKIKEEWEKVS